MEWDIAGRIKGVAFYLDTRAIETILYMGQQGKEQMPTKGLVCSLQRLTARSVT